MANYREDKAKAWQRSKAVTIKNEFQAIPTIEFAEEFVTTLDGSVINKRDMGSVLSSLKDPSITFDLLNPEDDTVIGNSNYGQAYVMLYSIYRFLADKRDIRDAKWAILVPIEKAYKDAQATATNAAAALTLAQANLKKDPLSGDYTTALNDAILANDTAVATLATATTAYNAAKAAYDAANDF